MKFSPIFDRVLIDRDCSGLEKKTGKAGLILPDNVKDKYKSSEGILILCGEECDDSVKALLGKKILFARYSGDDITLDGKEYVLATDRDIFGGLDE